VLTAIAQICGLDVRFHTYEGVVRALNGVNLTIFEGETLGLVGETGSGKTITGLALLRLIMPPGKIERGSIFFSGNAGTLDLLRISESEMRKIRGSQIAMIFQEPGAALNPVFTIGDQLTEGILLHRRQEVAKLAMESMDYRLSYATNSLTKILFRPIRLIKRKMYRDISENRHSGLSRFIERLPIVREFVTGLREEAKKIAAIALREVEIPDSDRIMKQYPHELSGGMKQRVVIAMALTCNSRLIIADEPTTSLDVTIQAQIIELLKKLKNETHTSMLYITHNLAVAAEICDRVAVLYAGNICEVASVFDIFKNPLHPYTKALMTAVPKPGAQPQAIVGFVPDPLSLPDGCPFQPRCRQAIDSCGHTCPSLSEVAPSHFVACYLFSGEKHDNSH
jgi:peptide/nickel transport system ATP-binding protein